MESQPKAPPTILVVFGVTGDLSRRYLLPALAQIALAEELPPACHILGITRQDIGLNDLIEKSANTRAAEAIKLLKKHFEIHKMEVSNINDYHALKNKLDKLAKQLGAKTQIIFHFVVPPSATTQIIKLLGESGLNSANIKLLLEKPFGHDLESAKEVIAQTAKYFKEEQLYRIDHYLAKEMAQNITVFLSSNVLFRNVWNKQFIEKIEVIGIEQIGIEGRDSFYEQTGALRDYAQSHLMQLAALVLMYPCPDPFDFGDLPARRLKALSAIEAIASNEYKDRVVRGQYKGYRKEVNNPKSLVETFIHLKVHSKDERWEGVPIYLTTGKLMNERLTAIRVYFKKIHDKQANLLTLRVQPDEGIALDLWLKEPGYSDKIEKHSLRFTYQRHFGRVPEAYERVLLDAIRGNHNLFATSQEIIESWRILQPVQTYWEMHKDDLVIYEPGSSIEQVLEARK